MKVRLYGSQPPDNVFPLCWQAEIERQIRQKIEMQSTHAQQMHYKALRMQAEKEEEDEFRKQVGALSLIDISISSLCYHCGISQTYAKMQSIY